jgi:ATP-binding cassette subfamily F protein uup
MAFPGVVLVVSHDRYFLNRVCTDILAFEDSGRIVHSVGDYDYFLEKKRRAAEVGLRGGATAASPRRSAAPLPGAADVKPAKPRKLTWSEARELEGMEGRILVTEAEIARVEGLFATPDFHRQHGARTEQLADELKAAKAKLVQLYARWEELEAVRLASEKPSAG